MWHGAEIGVLGRMTRMAWQSWARGVCIQGEATTDEHEWARMEDGKSDSEMDQAFPIGVHPCSSVVGLPLIFALPLLSFAIRPLFGILVLLFATPCFASEFTLWAAPAMDRVMRDQLAPSAWQPEISAARNEWESFQVIISGAPEEIGSVVVTGTSLQGPDGAIIAAPRCLREHYVTISKPSELSSMPAGEYPDALVPQSFPWQKLPATETTSQPFWIDVFVPSGTPPGDYRGSIDVRSPGRKVSTLDYTLHVWSFTLPKAPALRSSMFIVWRRIAEIHGFNREESTAAPRLQSILDDYYDMLAEHRLSPHEVWATYPDANEPMSEASNAKMAAALRKHLLQRQPATIGLPLWFDWPLADPLGKDREAAMDYVVRYYRMCEAVGCAERLYKIFGELDEPNTAEKYKQVRQWGKFFQEVQAKHGVRIPMLVTEGPKPRDEAWGSLVGAPSIWVPHVSEVWNDSEGPNAPNLLAQRRAAGDELWTYVALIQAPDEWKKMHGWPKQLSAGQPPVWITDYPPMNHRILPWLMPLHGITGFTYWDTSNWKGGKTFDPWQNNGTYPHDNDEVYNGDGFLIYPARQETHGSEGPVASIRLKWLREGVDDYDYLRLIMDRGFTHSALELAKPFARGFGDWDDNVPALYEARAKLALIIEKLGAKNAAPR